MEGFHLLVSLYCSIDVVLLCTSVAVRRRVLRWSRGVIFVVVLVVLFVPIAARASFGWEGGYLRRQIDVVHCPLSLHVCVSAGRSSAHHPAAEQPLRHPTSLTCRPGFAHARRDTTAARRFRLGNRNVLGSSIGTSSAAALAPPRRQGIGRPPRRQHRQTSSAAALAEHHPRNHPAAEHQGRVGEHAGRRRSSALHPAAEHQGRVGEHTTRKSDANTSSALHPAAEQPLRHPTSLTCRPGFAHARHDTTVARSSPRRQHQLPSSATASARARQHHLAVGRASLTLGTTRR